MRSIILVFLSLLSANFAIANSNSLINVKRTLLTDNKLRIDFYFQEPLQQAPASFSVEQPPRIVLHFLDTKNGLKKLKPAKIIEIGALTNYTIVADNGRMRVILDLLRPVSYAGTISGRVYSLTLSERRPRLPLLQEVLDSAETDDMRYTLKSLDYRPLNNEGMRIFIGLSADNIPIDVTETGKEVVVNFMNTQISTDLIKRYPSVLRNIAKNLRIMQNGKNAKLTVESQNGSMHYFSQVNKRFVIDIYPKSVTNDKRESSDKIGQEQRKISLNFQKIPLRAVLQLLADFNDINMVISEQVKGDITLRLNNIPWENALDIILTTNALAKYRVGEILMITPLTEIVKRKLEKAKANEEVVHTTPLVTQFLQINYAKASDIANLIKDKNDSLLSDRGSLSVDARTNSLWIEESAAQLAKIFALIKQIDIPVKQVLIEARIVNVTKDFAEDLGIRFGLKNPDTAKFLTEVGASETAPLNKSLSISEKLNVDFAANPLAGTPLSMGIALATLGEGILLDLELSALESEGRGEIISSPRLITTNQQAAVIESGEEIPYQEATASGATAVAFKKAVLSLKVTPQITPDNKIMMDLQINQDTPSPRTFNGVPVIQTKEIQTKVLVNNSQTIVLGGIYKRNKNNTVNRVPFLGNLPLVGVLFKNQSTSVKNEELLIFITPRIITNALPIAKVEGKKGIEPRRFGKLSAQSKSGR